MWNYDVCLTSHEKKSAIFLSWNANDVFQIGFALPFDFVFSSLPHLLGRSIFFLLFVASLHHISFAPWLGSIEQQRGELFWRFEPFKARESRVVESFWIFSSSQMEENKRIEYSRTMECARSVWRWLSRAQFFQINFRVRWDDSSWDSEVKHQIVWFSLCLHVFSISLKFCWSHTLHFTYTFFSFFHVPCSIVPFLFTPTRVSTDHHHHHQRFNIFNNHPVSSIFGARKITQDRDSLVGLDYGAKCTTNIEKINIYTSWTWDWVRKRVKRVIRKKKRRKKNFHNIRNKRVEFVME